MNSLVDKLGKTFEIEDDEAYDACRNLLVGQMKYVFSKSKDNPNLNKAPREKALRWLNEKSISQCEKIYNERSDGSKSSSRSMGQYAMDRETEIHGGRRNRVAQRPRNMMRQSGNRGIQETTEDFGSGGAYAPIVDAPVTRGRTYVAADGTVRMIL